MIEVLIRHRNLLLGGYLLGALFFLVAIESVFNGGFFFAISSPPQNLDLPQVYDPFTVRFLVTKILKAETD